MADSRANPGVWELISLHHSRILVRRPRYLLLALGIAVAYALVAMVVGGMLEIFWPPAHLSSYWVVLTSGTPTWNYPGVLAVNPYFVLSLPFLPTVFMGLISAGVGLGMSVAVVLSANLLRRRAATSARPATVGTAAGLTPAMIALVTLGACCSTTAAATAGIGLTAQATGTTTDALLLNNWYLGLFQLVILYVALLAQEQLLTIYGGLLAPGTTSTGMTEPPPGVDRRFAAAALVRVVLIAAGVTWSLSMVAEWLSADPGTASASTWVGWVLQHQLVGVTALLAGLFPGRIHQAFVQHGASWPSRVLRAVLLVGGVSLAIGVPPPLLSVGWHGFVNELLGLLGVSASSGAVSPGLSWGLPLAVRWATQYVSLGSFAVALGLRPLAALRPLMGTATRSRGTGLPGTVDVRTLVPQTRAPERGLGLVPEAPR